MIRNKITMPYSVYRWSQFVKVVNTLLIFTTLLFGCASYEVVHNSNNGFDIVPPRPLIFRDISIAYERPVDSEATSSCSIHHGPFHLNVVSDADLSSGFNKPRLRAWVDRFPADKHESELCRVAFQTQFERQVCEFGKFEKDLYAEEGRCLEYGEASRIIRRVGSLFRSPIELQLRFAQGIRQFTGNKNFAISVDIVPGMKLCWLPAPPGRPQGRLPNRRSSFLSQSEVCIMVGTRDESSGHWLTFEPFLAQQAKLVDSPTIGTTDFSRFGSPMDLQEGKYSTARLFLPQQYAKADTHLILDLRMQPFVLAADSLEVLEAAVKRCIHPGTNSSPTAKCLKKVRLFTPDYRALWIPYFEVTIQGQREWISVGTTVRDVVDRIGLLSGQELQSAVRLKRRVGTKQYRVHFPSDLRAFELPLIAGDDLQW
jgi:hypothetical protein